LVNYLDILNLYLYYKRKYNKDISLDTETKIMNKLKTMNVKNIKEKIEKHDTISYIEQIKTIQIK
jgi:hypothetical protein